ncbi:hypothetical protein KI387_026980 [Taxus chinensis]|uniref:Uncharacterized protein n=1 Tax=Taxus chinensis TaxID=29808 RepID=A0AA38L8K6_TAXCH|nr:hypothetical protein KI387_026980 [Taxus chinensis]
MGTFSPGRVYANRPNRVNGKICPNRKANGTSGPRVREPAGSAETGEISAAKKGQKDVGRG